MQYEDAKLVFLILSIPVALITRKDLAFWCFGGFLLSYLVPPTWAYESEVMAYGSIAMGMAFISYVHYRKSRYPLSLAIMAICALMLCNQVAQMIQFTMLTYWVGVALGVLMLAALMFIPGRKELLHDMADDIRMLGSSSLSDHDHHHDSGSVS